MRRIPASNSCAAALAARWPWLAGCLAGCALALLVVCGSLNWVKTVHASSENTIIMSPPTAAAGTQVTADVHYFLTQQSFVLEATTTPLYQGGCASALPIPGAPTFEAGAPAGGHVTFSWPASLGTNVYWLCAVPTAGGPDLAHTNQPFIVTQDTSPTLSVTPPPEGALAGSTLRVAIADWKAPDHQEPAHLWIVSPDGLIRSEVTFQVVTPLDATGACALSLVLPLDIPSGNWFLIAGSAAYYQRSDSITVQDPKIATAIAIMNASPTASHAVDVTPATSPKSDDTPFVFVLGAGGMLLLVVGCIALVVVRRR